MCYVDGYGFEMVKYILEQDFGNWCHFDGSETLPIYNSVKNFQNKKSLENNLIYIYSYFIVFCQF